MKHHTPSFTRRNVKAYFASLLAYLLLAGQMTPLVLAANSPARRVAPSPKTDVARESAGEAPRLEAAAPAPPAAPAAFAPTITATKTDSFPDPDMDGKAAPGATITYTVTINNSGPDPANNLTLTDTIDPNTSFLGTPVASPIALDESYSVLGNVRIQPNAAAGLLANEVNPNTGDNTGLTASGPTTSANNGNVTVNADGSFSYNPAPGFTGTDSFTYTVTSANGSDTATVTLNVAGLIWFIDDNAAAGGDGRLTSPYNCVVGPTCFDPLAADEAGDNIFVYAGAYTDTAALTLLNNQKVIGQGASAATTLDAAAGVTLPPHSDALPALNGDPSTVVVNSAASGIVVTTGNTNTLRGFTLGNNGPGAKIFSTAFTLLNVSEVALTGTGTALNLDSGTLNAAFTGIGSTTAAGQGINLDQIAGTLTSSGGTSIVDPVAQGILVTASTANLNFGNTVVSDATDGVSLQNNSAGTRTFGTLSVMNGTGVGFQHANGGGATNVTGATTIVNPVGIGISVANSNADLSFAGTTVGKNNAGTGVSLTNNASRTITFSTLAVTTANGAGLVASGGGAVNVTNAAGSAINATAVATTAAPAIDANGVALGANFTTVTANGSGLGTGVGVSLVSVSGALAVNNGAALATSVTNTGGAGIVITSSTAALGFANTSVGATGGAGVTIGSTGGNVSFADLDIAPDSGQPAFVASANTGTLTTTSGTIDATNSVALDITGPAGRTPLAMTLTFVESTNSASASGGVNLSLVSGNLTVGAAGGGVDTNITSPTQFGLRVLSSGAGTINFGDASVTGTGGTAVVLGTAGNGNAGNVTFPTLTVGASTASRYAGGAGVSITDGTGTDSLGVLNVFTTNQAGLSATNFDGTLNVTNGTVDTGTGAGVNIDGPAGLTTLGVSLTRLVSAGGTTPGITVRDTNGSFAVTAGGSGDACTSAADCDGGSISGKTGTSETTGTPGVRISNTTNFSLNRVNISGNNHSGIYGGIVSSPSGAIDTSKINGFELVNCNITNNGDTVTSNPDEVGVDLYNVTGSAAGGSNPTRIINSTITNNEEFQVQVTNESGTLTNFQLTNNTISNLSGAPGGEPNPDGVVSGNLVNFIARNTAVMTLNTSGGTYTGNAPFTASGIQCDVSGGTNNCNVTGGTFTNNNVAANMTQSAAGILNFNVSNTSSTGNRAHGLNLFIGASSTAAVNGKFLNNVVGTAGVAGSGSSLGVGIRVQNEGTNTSNPVNVLIQGNTVQEVFNASPSIDAGNGIQVFQGIAGPGITTSKTTNATITNNVVRDIDEARAIVVQQNNSAAGATGSTCADISGNEMNNIFGLTNAPSPGGDGSKIRVRQLASATFLLRQTNQAGLAAANSPPNGVAVTTTTTAQVSVGGTMTPTASACTQPTNGPVEFISDGGSVSDEITPGGGPTAIGGLGRTPATRDTNVTSRAFVSPIRLVKTQAAQPVVQQRATASAKAAPLQTKSVGAVQTKGAANAARPASATAGDTPRINPPVIMGDTLTWNVGTLPANSSVTITFQVTVDNPYSGPPQVSNQGTVSATGISNVLTDDPSEAGPANPTVTPVLATNIFGRDGKAPEPPSGTAPLVFTIALSTPATGAVTVNYSTADGGATPATGGADCNTPGVDYVTVAGGVATFGVGEQLRTVSVDICSDGTAEADETFLLNLTGATGGAILDNQATGTITAANPAGTTLISELRTFGPGTTNDPNDDFVELYNNTDSPVTVAASDASAGWGVYTTTSGCDSAPLLLGVIPNGTVIPARGHFLLTGSAYSLANYGGTGAAAGNLTMAADLPSNASVAVFNTGDITNLSTVTRLDAVGFGANAGGAVCDLLREGTTAPSVVNNLTMLGQYSVLRDPCGKGGSITAGGPCPTTGNPKDSNVNGADFLVVDPNGTNTGAAAQRIGAAGPENLASPIRRDATIGIVPFDGSQAPASPPNRVRDFTSDPGNNSTFGTMSIRRRFVNNTGAPVTRLRFRIVDISTFGPAPAGTADVRARTSPALTSVTVNDAATCAATGAPATAPCMAPLLGTTLEEPPTQSEGGGFNSTLSAGTITTGTPLAPGASINLQFLLGIEQTGAFKFYFIIEALP